MSDNTLHVKDINQYHQHFRDQARQFSRGPNQNRTCQDKFCYILFILITIAFVSMGVYFIQAAKLSDLKSDYFKSNDPNHLAQDNSEFPGVENLKPAVPVIIGMIGLAVVTAVMFLLLLMKFPQCMFYSMLAISAILMVALIIILAASANYIAALILAVIFIVFVCVLLCNKEKVRIGIVLLYTAANFLSEKKTVFLAPFFMLIFILVFEFFWIASLVGIILYKGDSSGQTSSQNEAQQEQNSHIFILWSFFHIFYSVFFNYCLVFIIATACGMWYYNIDSNYLTTAVSRILRFHIGSFTFAALLVTIVTMLRQQAQQGSRQNGACAICLCLVACCLSFIQDLLETLNHNSIIVMSVTGESYIDSAKSTISLIFDNFTLFFVVDIISSIVKFTGILLICGVPSLVGYFLLRETAENPDDHTYIVIGMVAIILISILIGLLFLGVLSQALSCVFIFYCFDKKFHQLGFQITNEVPHEMRKLFDSLESSLNPNMNSGERGYHGEDMAYGSPQYNQQPYQGNPYQGNPYQSNPYQSNGNHGNSGYPSLNGNQRY